MREQRDASKLYNGKDLILASHTSSMTELMDAVLRMF